MIMMKTVYEFMGKDHDELDGKFKSFSQLKKNDKDKAKKMFHDFKIGLQKHIVWEEEILFPLFEDKTGMYNSGPTGVMRIEHRKIKDFLEKIHGKIAKGDFNTDKLENELVEVLTEHNNKEENILYPEIDNLTSDKEKSAAFKKMMNLPAEKYDKCCE